MEMVFYVQDEKCSITKEGSSDSSTKAVTFPGASGEDNKVITLAGRTNSFSSSSTTTTVAISNCEG